MSVALATEERKVSRLESTVKTLTEENTTLYLNVQTLASRNAELTAAVGTLQYENSLLESERTALLHNGSGFLAENPNFDF
jgi:hypothetical protein